MPVLVLLLMFGFALGTGATIAILVAYNVRRRLFLESSFPDPNDLVRDHTPLEPASGVSRPPCWLAVRSRSLADVQAALGLQHVRRCILADGLPMSAALYVSPPIGGWVLVLGPGLPEPSDDVDACFRFVLELSRRLGRVQFFCARRIINHHAWVIADHGKIIRAYAWAQEVLWNEGNPTAAEKELGMQSYDYLEEAELPSMTKQDLIESNVDKVPALAARWSLDPAVAGERFLREQPGVAGDGFRRF
jgi:hypothetical protein